jgi:hypothetical protein
MTLLPTSRQNGSESGALDELQVNVQRSVDWNWKTPRF